jgi:hypothetical protein
MFAATRSGAFFPLACQQVPALLLEGVDFAQYRFDVFALLLQDGAAFFQDLKEALELGLVITGRVVHIDQFADLHQRKAEPLAPYRELQPHPVTMAIDPRSAGALRGQQAVILIEANRPRGQAEFARKVGDGISGVRHAIRSLRKRKVEFEYSAGAARGIKLRT